MSNPIFLWLKSPKLIRRRTGGVAGPPFFAIESVHGFEAMRQGYRFWCTCWMRACSRSLGISGEGFWKGSVGVFVSWHVPPPTFPNSSRVAMLLVANAKGKAAQERNISVPSFHSGG